MSTPVRLDPHMRSRFREKFPDRRKIFDEALRQLSHDEFYSPLAL